MTSHTSEPIEFTKTYKKVVYERATNNTIIFTGCCKDFTAIKTFPCIAKSTSSPWLYEQDG